MLSRRTLASLVILTLPLAACGSPGGGPAPAASAPFDAKAALVASAAGIRDGNYSFRMSVPGDDDASGTVHVPSRSIGLRTAMRLDEKTTADVEMRVIGTLNYSRIRADPAQMAEVRQQKQMLEALGRPGDPKAKQALRGVNAMIDRFGGERWIEIDRTRLSDPSRLEIDLSTDSPDVTGIGALVAWAATAQGDPATIRGTLDTTTVVSTQALLNKAALAGIPAAAAKAVPFTATLDYAGRLVTVEMDLPAFGDHPAGRWTAEFTGYGAAPAQQAPPAAEVNKTTQEAYDQFNR